MCWRKKKKPHQNVGVFVEEWRTAFFVCVNLEVIISIAELYQQSSEEKALVHD